MVKRTSPKQVTVKYQDPETDEIEEYVLKLPTGSLGWKHFRLLSEINNERKNTIVEQQPDNREYLTVIKEDNKTGEPKEVQVKNPNFGGMMRVELPNPKLDEVILMVMDKWVEEILPHVMVSPENYDDVVWDRIPLLFRACSENSSIDLTNFRPDT